MQGEIHSIDASDYNGSLNWDFVKRNIVRGFKFTVAGGTGFFIAEAILFLGIALVGESYLLEINSIAAILRIAGGFFINELWKHTVFSRQAS